MSVIYKICDKTDCGDFVTGAEYGTPVKWVIGEKHSKVSGKPILCSPNTVYHAYDNPYTPLFFYSTRHGHSHNPALFVGEGVVVVSEWDKIGCSEITLTKQLDYILPTTTQYVRFGILCAREVTDNPEWLEWAHNWLSGKDRSEGAALAAAAVVSLESAAVEAAWAAGLGAGRGRGVGGRAYRALWLRGDVQAMATQAVRAAASSAQPVNFAALAKEALSQP